ncbi:peptidase [Altererythrobacter indicus]|uniref:Peptidase n=1 Tax=Altericroceibacterium indicum TaxID=374177 RepID=A0A845ADW5_9SPHN|nr:peptidase [Altericroceibacterium indicum]
MKPQLPSGNVRKRTRNSGRSLWWRIHQWAGLQISLFLIFILATGTLATVSPEIDWLIHPAIRVAVEDRPLASWGVLATHAKDEAGDALIESISAPREPWFAAEVIARQPDGSRFRIQLNPWTGEVQGRTPWFNAQRLFREMHRNLMLAPAIGVPIVTSLSIPLLLALISSFWVYKKWWRGFFTFPRLNRARRNDSRRFTGALHRFAGLWSLWFVALIGITGTWYFIEKMGGEAPASNPAAAIASTQLAGPQLDAMIALAHKRFPELQVKGIAFPHGKSGGVLIEGQAHALLVRDRANGVLIDPITRKVAAIVRGENLSVHQRIAEAADPLHFGTWGGFTTRLIWFAFGAILTALSVTGVMIYAMRMRQQEKLPRMRLVQAMWKGMGPARWVALLLIVMTIALIPSKMTA